MNTVFEKRIAIFYTDRNIDRHPNHAKPNA